LHQFICAWIPLEASEINGSWAIVNAIEGLEILYILLSVRLVDAELILIVFQVLTHFLFVLRPWCGNSLADALTGILLPGGCRCCLLGLRLGYVLLEFIGLRLSLIVFHLNPGDEVAQRVSLREAGRVF